MAFTLRTKSVVACILVFFIIGAVAYYSIPILKGKYQHDKFVSNISIDMEIEEVHKIAAGIGFFKHDCEVIGKGIVGNAEKLDPNILIDVYYFKNFMLDSAVAIYYNKTGKVAKIIAG